MRVLVFGDNIGIPQLLTHLPKESVVGIVAASIRPDCIPDLTEHAERIGVPFIVQPKWKSDDYAVFVNRVRALKPDLFWVHSYSMIIRNDVIDSIRLGGVNIHASLLPRNRGCNPMQWAIINGENETGVTLHRVDSGLDTGDIIDQLKIQIELSDTWLDLKRKTAEATDILIADNLFPILSNSWSSVPQDELRMTVGRRRKPSDGEIVWSDPVIDIYNKVRALVAPLPPAFYTDGDGETVAIPDYKTLWEIAVLKYELNTIEGEATPFEEGELTIRPVNVEDLSGSLPGCPLSITAFESELSSTCSPESCFEVVRQAMRSHSDLILFLVQESTTGQPVGFLSLFNIDVQTNRVQVQVFICEEDGSTDRRCSEAVVLARRFAETELGMPDLSTSTQHDEGAEFVGCIKGVRHVQTRFRTRTLSIVGRSHLVTMYVK